MIMYMTEMSMHAKVGENGPETSKHISMKAMTKSSSTTGVVHSLVI